MKSKVSIGLDVGSRHINMVKLSKELGGLRLLDFASVGLNPKHGQEEKLGQLEKIVQERGLAGSGVNIGVSGASLIVRYITLPKMDAGQIREALKYEAQQYIPFRMEEVIFDYQILKTLEQEPNKMKVLLVAAKKGALMESAELLGQAGLKPNLIDVNSFAVINCFQINGPRIKEGDVFALINLEFDLVNINILQGESPYFTRDISLLEELLSLRMETGEDAPVFERIKPILSNLIREVRISIDYFESEFAKRVNSVYFSGEGAKLPELIDFFSTHLSREIKLWNPVQNLLTDSVQIDGQKLKDTQSLLALACGLALRNL